MGSPGRCQEIGIDVVSVARVRGSLEQWGETFRARLSGPDERAVWPADELAVATCLAVKEAVVKALGGRGRGFRWADVEVGARDSAVHVDVPVEAVDAMRRVTDGVTAGAWRLHGALASVARPGPRWWLAGSSSGWLLAMAGG